MDKLDDYKIDTLKTVEICEKIVKVVTENDPVESYTALITVLCNVFIWSGCTRADFLKDLGKSWDHYEAIHKRNVRQP